MALDQPDLNKNNLQKARERFNEFEQTDEALLQYAQSLADRGREAGAKHGAASPLTKLSNELDHAVSSARYAESIKAEDYDLRVDRVADLTEELRALLENKTPAKPVPPPGRILH